MNQLEWPFDAKFIIKNKKRIRRELLESRNEFINKKVAILGGSTTNDITRTIELFLLNYGIKPEFYESEYNQYYQDAMFPNPKLEQFGPDIIYVCTSNRNITRYPELTNSEEQINEMIFTETKKYVGIWDRLYACYHCPIIQNNFEMPFYRLMGNKDVSDIHGAGNYITRLNLEFYNYAQKHEDFFICDLNYISADYGLREWSDPFYWYMYKYAMNVAAIPYLAFNVANIIKSLFGKNKKGFVLDLDNTLWGGIIGEDGVDNIELGKEEPSGYVYNEFQNYIKAHKQLGIVLNVNSKNDYENAVLGLKHPDSELKPEDFIIIKANWDSKDQNFLEIAKELKLLPESLVFVDDNPAERHIVREQIPGVSVPEIGESHQFIENIDRNGYFEVTTFSSDDLNRNKMYMENEERLNLQASFTDYGDYLRSLDMMASIKPFESIYMSRIAQLTNKSNQFNLTTRRYTQSEIEDIAEDESYITLYGKLKDKFGDNGVITVIIGKVENDTCHIELWLMSCRVLKRDMEYAMMDNLVDRCRDKNIAEIRGYYYATAKNSMVKDFYKLMGFEMVSSEEDNTVWSFQITDSYKAKNKYISMEEST